MTQFQSPTFCVHFLLVGVPWRCRQCLQTVWEPSFATEVCFVVFFWRGAVKHCFYPAVRALCRLRVFESGVLVVQSLSHSEEAVTKESQKLVGQHVSFGGIGVIATPWNVDTLKCRNLHGNSFCSSISNLWTVDTHNNQDTLYCSTFS